MRDIEKVIELLNCSIKRDNEAIQNLFSYSVPCNDNLADDPYIQVLEREDGRCYVRMIGIINGVLNALGETKIAIIEEDGEILGFQKYKQ